MSELEKDTRKKRKKVRRKRDEAKKMSEKDRSTGKKAKWLWVLLLVVIVGSMAAGGVYAYRSWEEYTLAMKTDSDRREFLEESLSLFEGVTAASAELVREDVRQQQAAAGALQAAWEAMWPKEIEITADNAKDFAVIERCEIADTDVSKVVISGSMEGIPKSDDRRLYVFNLPIYRNTLSEGQEPIASVRKSGDSFAFEVNLNYKQAGSRLFDQFVVAIRQNGSYTSLSDGKFITNPEARAQYTYAYPKAASIKGLLVDPAKLDTGELEDLGVKQAAYNITVGRLIGPTSSANYPTIYYNYNGKTYAFDGQVVAEYDIVFSNLTRKGIQTTAIILNDWNGAYLDLVHPNARSHGKSQYYMFNAADAAGVDILGAVGTFLAERYSGTAHGQVVNWVIANEINARTEWNHYASTDVNSYTVEYAKGFRVFYNAIKSVNANAKIYIPIDQTWNRNLNNNNTYDGRDVLDIFNSYLRAGGNIDWDLSQHPYPVPLTHAAFWNMPSNYRRMNLIRYSADSPMVNIQNLNVVTDYLQREEMLNPYGESRSVILSEVGFTSTQGDGIQAAAFAYAYYIAEANSHVDGLLLNRQTDAPEEIAQGLALGICHTNGARKQIYNVFKHIDTGASRDVTEFAKGIIGISNWSEVIRHY